MRVLSRFRLQSLLRGASGLAFGTLSMCGYALGLGELQSQSYLGQPLKARIPLVSVEGNIDPENLRVRQVSAAEAERLGVEFVYNPYKLKFEVDQQAGGYQVFVESENPVKEPFLTLLLELSWPSGVVYREYSILLDPPPVISVAQSGSTNRPPATTSPEATGVRRSSAVPRDPPQAAAPRRAPRLDLQPLQTSEGRYRVKSGDTLWSIAQRWREGTDLSTQDASQWLFENNPQAFVRGDMDKLRADALLQMPDVKEFQVTEGGAAAEQSSANQAGPADSSDAESAETSVAIPAAETPIISATEPREESSAEDTVVRSDAKGLLTVGAANRDDRTRELIDMLVRENETLRNRMEKLESSEYLTTLRDLVILQQRQIVELRERLGLENTPEAEATDAMLARIGLDPQAELSTESASDTEAEPATPPATDEQVEATPASLVEADRENLPTEQPPEKSWLTWLLFAAAAGLAAVFTLLFVFYRRHAEQEADEEEDDRRLPTLQDGIRKSELLGSSSEPTETSLHVVGQHEPDPQLTEAWSAPRIERKKDETVPYADAETSEDFNELILDEELLEVLTADDHERSLEALTQEWAPDRPRRSDDEVRMSIAEKMANYKPDDPRDELESLGVTELDDLVDLSNVDEYNVDKVIYRAMMFCDFKKFSQARQLIEVVMQEQYDPRLEETLDQIDSLEREHIKRANG